MERLFDPFGVRLELRGSFGEPDSSAVALVDDRPGAQWILRRIAADPANRWALRKALLADDALVRRVVVVSPDELAARLARELEAGAVSLYPATVRARPALKGPEDDPVEGLLASAPAPAEEPEYVEQDACEPKIRDLKLRCEHEFDGLPRTPESSYQIAVVPGPNPPVDPGDSTIDTEDVVTLLLRDDFGPLPGFLIASPEGGRSSQARDLGDSGGGYHRYEVPVEYLGDSILDVFSAEFWRAHNATTIYRVEGTPQPVTIEVYDPYFWTFKFEMPAFWQRAKMGSKLGADDKVPSERSDNPDLGICLQRSDGIKGDLKIVELIGGIAKAINRVMGIKDAIEDNVPKIGWYFESDLRFMQGSFETFWGWREHTDHRVFRYREINIDMVFIAAKLEIGFGLKFVKHCRAQLYVSLEGDVTRKVSVKLDRPDALDDPDKKNEVGLGLKGTIKGRLGARVEAGNYIDAFLEGETGLEVEGGINVESGDRACTVNGSIKWTGIRANGVFSLGIGGISGEKTWSGMLVAPRDLGTFRFPEPEPYSPSHLTRAEIESELERVLTRGLNVRVFTEADQWYRFDQKWPIQRIVEPLAAKIDEHRTIARDRKTIEGVAHQIRTDLDELGERMFRDYVDARTFESYVEGPVLRQHLDAARDLGLELVEAVTPPSPAA